MFFEYRVLEMFLIKYEIWKMCETFFDWGLSVTVDLQIKTEFNLKLFQ
jgi:hypothetical protein